MSKFLITGFEPFGELAENPTRLLIHKLQQQFTADPRFRFEILPTVFGESSKQLLEAAEEFQPDFVLLTGVAENASALRLESLAVNADHARIADNKGNQPINQKIDQQGPEALRTVWELSALHSAIEELSLPVEYSFFAGTYVCNHIYYHAMNSLNCPVLFMHVPNVLAPNPVMTLDNLCDVVNLLIERSNQLPVS